MAASPAGEPLWATQNPREERALLPQDSGLFQGLDGEVGLRRYNPRLSSSSTISVTPLLLV